MALVIVSYEPLDVGQLVVQVLAALLFLVVIWPMLFHFFVLFQNFFMHLLGFLGAEWQPPGLGVKLGEAAGGALHTGMQEAVLVVLGVEVILVTLPLVHGHQR